MNEAFICIYYFWVIIREENTKRESSFEPLTESIFLQLEHYKNSPDFSEMVGTRWETSARHRSDLLTHWSFVQVKFTSGQDQVNKHLLETAARRWATRSQRLIMSQQLVHFHTHQLKIQKYKNFNLDQLTNFEMAEHRCSFSTKLALLTPVLFKVLVILVPFIEPAHVSTCCDCNQNCLFNRGGCTLHKDL